MHMLLMTVEQLIIRCLSEFCLFDINLKHGYNVFLSWSIEIHLHDSEDVFPEYCFRSSDN